MEQYPYQFQPIPPRHSGFSVAALILGIIGLFIAFIPFVNFAVVVFGALALIFGIIGVIQDHKKDIAIIAIVLTVAAIITTIVMNVAIYYVIYDALSGEEAEEETETVSESDVVDVKFGKFTVVNNGYYADTKLPVTVTNKSKERHSFHIKVEAVDANGNRIDTDYIYAGDLGPGQSQQFDIFILVSEDKIDQFKKATFSVISISMY